MDYYNSYNNTIHKSNISESNQADINKHSESTSTDELNLLTIIHYLIISLVALHLVYFVYMLIKNNYCKSQSDGQENLRKINDECSICLDTINNEVQLLCSHSYCASCIIDYGKQRWGFVNIQCPICRTESKLMVIQFERNEDNKEQYDMILSYNHEVTAHYSTSLCLCFDIVKFSFFYFRQITNFNNPRYNSHRKIIIMVIIIILLYVLYPIKFVSDNLEVIEDILSYIFLIMVCSENFYRRFRRETNSEILLHEAEINSRNMSRVESHGDGDNSSRLEEGNSYLGANSNNDNHNQDVNIAIPINRENNVESSINQV